MCFTILGICAIYIRVVGSIKYLNMQTNKHCCLRSEIHVSFRLLLPKFQFSFVVNSSSPKVFDHTELSCWIN
jgi:hypothetical protein